MRTYSVYAISAEARYIKFWVTSDLKRRLRNLQHYSPFRLKALYISEDLPKLAAFSLEKVIHKAAVSYHAQGEWFKSCPKTLAIVNLLKTKPLDEISEILNKWAREELRFCIKQKLGPHRDGMFTNKNFVHYIGKRLS